MRRPLGIELMLLATVVLWALNLTVTRYILTHGFEPLAYATVRYGAAAVIFLGIALVAERSVRIARRDFGLVALAAIALWLNQLSFVFALEESSASSIALILGATPIFAAVIGIAFGLERLSQRFWIAAAVSFAGVALVATGSGAGLAGDVRGNLLGIATAATWAAYSLAITPLMQRYSASRISAVVLSLGWILIALVGFPQAAEQDYGLGWEVWALLAFATAGPLVLTNVLWFRVAAPDRRLAGDARRQPAAVRGRRLRAAAPLGADDAAAGAGRRPDRGRDPDRAPATARARLRVRSGG